MRKRTKAQQAELEALGKAHEEQKRQMKEAFAFQKKVFPEGVLKRAPNSTLEPFMSMKPIQDALKDGMLNEFASRLQAAEDAKNAKAKKAVDTTNGKKRIKADRRVKRISKYISSHPDAKPNQIIDALKLKVSPRQVVNDLKAIKNMEKR